MAETVVDVLEFAETVNSAVGMMNQGASDGDCLAVLSTSSEPYLLVILLNSRRFSISI
jgi:hypothetical protein